MEGQNERKKENDYDFSKSRGKDRRQEKKIIEATFL